LFQDLLLHFFYLIQEAGLAIGGPKFNPFVMLEVHLNNEEEETGSNI
jgi:hypothetical protein